MLKKIKTRLLPFVPEKIIQTFYNTKSVVVEVTNCCNLRCRVCPTPYMKRKRGFMKLDDFKTIIDKLPSSIELISMTWSGEPLLNKNIFKMVKYADSRGIKTHISTNATHIDDFKEKEIADSNLHSIAVCIDGFKQEHENYRKGSDFNHIIRNVKYLSRIKNKHGLKTKIIMQTLVKKDNYKQLDGLVKLANDMNLDEIQLRYFTMPGTLRIGNRKKLADEFLPPEQYSVYDRNLKIVNPPAFCYAFTSPVILWNGDMTTCCFDVEGEGVFGNILNDSWRNTYKKIPIKKIINMKLPYCKFCEMSSEINYKKITFT